MANIEFNDCYHDKFFNERFHFTNFHSNMNLICDNLQMTSLNYEQRVQEVALTTTHKQTGREFHTNIKIVRSKNAVKQAKTGCNA
jgi:hypothetical protein